ncbi:MAG: hypothetical protein EBR82_69170, partial [Caulobacteraceae bacterium]|nr:hypothetical protein [Caulobacteraceae bacterium]
MEGLVALVVIVWLTIQAVALTSIVLTLMNAKWIGFWIAAVALAGGLYTGRLRFEGLLYWFFPLVALVFWGWK